MSDVEKVLTLISFLNGGIPRDISRKISVEYLIKQFGLKKALEISACLGEYVWAKEIIEEGAIPSDIALRCSLRDDRLFKFLLQYAKSYGYTLVEILKRERLDLFKLLVRKNEEDAEYLFEEAAMANLPTFVKWINDEYDIEREVYESVLDYVAPLGYTEVADVILRTYYPSYSNKIWDYLTPKQLELVKKNYDPTEY